jgi:metal-sulfur cluster biosynthetic enzyme
MFIQTEQTRDPATLKFLPGRPILTEGALELADKAQAASSPLAERLFAIPGVVKVSFTRDCIAVTMSGGEWQLLKPVIFGAIMEHFQSGAPPVRPAAGAADLPNGQKATEPDGLFNRIRTALHEVIDPELGYNIADLGLIYEVGVEAGGNVRVTMTTTTPGCPATNYLSQGVMDKVTNVRGVTSVKVKLTYEPRWTPEMMSPEAKAHFGIT